MLFFPFKIMFFKVEIASSDVVVGGASAGRKQNVFMRRQLSFPREQTRFISLDTDEQSIKCSASMILNLVCCLLYWLWTQRSYGHEIGSFPRISQLYFIRLEFNFTCFTLHPVVPCISRPQNPALYFFHTSYIKGMPSEEPLHCIRRNGL